MSESYTTGGNALSNLGGNNFAGQSFTPREDHILNYIDINLRTHHETRVPSPNVYLADSEHKPTGPSISQLYRAYSENWNQYNIFRARLAMTPVQLYAGTEYVIVIHAFAVPQAWSLRWQYDKDNATYPRGRRCHSFDGGNTWTTYSAQDHIFAEFGDPPLPIPEPPPPVNNFAVLDLTKAHFASSIFFRLETSVPCHLTLYWTDKKPLQHHTSRILRGLEVPWGTYFCFVGWHPVDQVETGDTLYHTFIVSPWQACETKWFTIRGNVDNILSPSVGPIFEHHHPGLTTSEITIPITHQNDDCRLIAGIYQACPSVCPPVLQAGRWQTSAQMSGSHLRFRDSQLPWLAAIDEAYVTFTAMTSPFPTFAFFRISAEQMSNPPDFSLDNWTSAWNRYQNHTSQVNWDTVGQWLLDQEYQSPNISVPIQQIVNRDYWKSGNAIVLFWEDYDHRSPWVGLNHRRAYPYNVDSSKSVRLYVKYTS